MYARLIGEDIALKVDGPLLFLRRTVEVGLNEAVEVEAPDATRLGRIAALDEDTITIEVLDETSGLALDGTRIRFFGEPLRFHVGPGLLGRVFNGVGEPIDGGPPLAARPGAADRRACRSTLGARRTARLHPDRLLRHRRG